MGINLDSGVGANYFINPNMAGNVTGGVRVSGSTNKFLGCYVENDSTPSNFIFETGTDNDPAYFSAFGQPATITNSAGPSNMVWYTDKNGFQSFAGFYISPSDFGTGRTYQLLSGIESPGDLSISDDQGKLWLDFSTTLVLRPHR